MDTHVVKFLVYHLYSTFVTTKTRNNFAMINSHEIHWYSRPKWLCVHYKLPDSAKFMGVIVWKFSQLL